MVIPAVVTNIRLNKEIFNNREDVLDVLNDTLDMRLSTASILGARFPYISPAGRVDQWLPEKIRVKKIRQHADPLLCGWRLFR